MRGLPVSHQHPNQENAMDKREPLTVSVVDAAELLGISRAFAYELVARGELPSVRLGRRVVIPRRALEALVEQPGTRSWSA
jgi:excisionase family DNA binding protein